MGGQGRGRGDKRGVGGTREGSGGQGRGQGIKGRETLGGIDMCVILIFQNHCRCDDFKPFYRAHGQTALCPSLIVWFGK